MDSSIGFQLGIGSGLDINALVRQLADAQRAPKDALIEKRQTLNTAQLSGLSQASGAIDSLSAAITSLVGGGTLRSKPVSSDETAMAASAIPGAQFGDLSAQLQVRQLATSQNLVSTALASSSTVVGLGQLTLTVNGTSANIVIDAGNNSLDGLAAAVNATALGVTASVVTDSTGARLIMKGRLGAANAFTLSTTSGGTIRRFQYPAGTGGGMTAPQTARDAIVRIDGVDVRRPTNSVEDLIPGVKLELKRASTTVTLTLGVQRPTSQVEEGVANFVAAFNEVSALLAELTAARLPGAEGGGALSNDLAARELRRQLAQLPLTPLSGGTGPRTLAEIGVATNRDGSLTLNTGRLREVLTRDPQGVEALFNPTHRSSNPLVRITSPFGRGKPGTYELTGLAAGPPPSGTIDGVAMDVSGTSLIAPVTSRAAGLTISVGAGATSATLTVDAGLAGAVQNIRDTLLARNGIVAQSRTRYEADQRRIADDKTAIETRASAYYNQLLKTFTAMERRVSSFRATQSYLDQQVKMWTNDQG